jgi:hypothetical protein
MTKGAHCSAQKQMNAFRCLHEMCLTSLGVEQVATLTTAHHRNLGFEKLDKISETLVFSRLSEFALL